MRQSGHVALEGFLGKPDKGINEVLAILARGGHFLAQIDAHLLELAGRLLAFHLLEDVVRACRSLLGRAGARADHLEHRHHIGETLLALHANSFRGRRHARQVAGHVLQFKLTQFAAAGDHVLRGIQIPDLDAEMACHRLRGIGDVAGGRAGGLRGAGDRGQHFHRALEALAGGRQSLHAVFQLVDRHGRFNRKPAHFAKALGDFLRRGIPAGDADARHVAVEPGEVGHGAPGLFRHLIGGKTGRGRLHRLANVGHALFKGPRLSKLLGGLLEPPQVVDRRINARAQGVLRGDLRFSAHNGRHGSPSQDAEPAQGMRHIHAFNFGRREPRLHQSADQGFDVVRALRKKPRIASSIAMPSAMFVARETKSQSCPVMSRRA